MGLTFSFAKMASQGFPDQRNCNWHTVKDPSMDFFYTVWKQPSCPINETERGLPFDIGGAANCAKSLSEPSSLPHYWENTVYLLCHCKGTDGAVDVCPLSTLSSQFVHSPVGFCLRAGIECLARARMCASHLHSLKWFVANVSAGYSRSKPSLRSVASHSTWPVTRYH